MSVRRRWRIPLGLRFSLALAMVPLVALPPIGLRFVEVMAEFARNERLENQAQAARNLAATLQGRQALFDVEQATSGLHGGAEWLPVELLADVVADQDPREWIDTPGRAIPMQADSPQRDADRAAPAMHVRLAAARAQERPGQFFLLVDADDERLVLPQIVDGVELAGDRLIIEYGDAPDRMRAREVTPRERPGGWLAEIGFAEEPRFLRVRVIDVDYLGSRRIEGRGDSGLLTPVQPLAGQTRDPRGALWVDAVRMLAHASGRVSVFDAGGALLAQTGTIAAGVPPPTDWQGRLARRLLAASVHLRPGRFEVFAPETGAPDPAQRSPFSQALAGFAMQQAERVDSDSGLPAWLISSAQPVWVGDRVVGALVIEEHTGSRLGAYTRAIERLTLLTAAAMAASALALLAVGSITVARIVRLRGQAERAIDSRGRVVGSVREPLVSDEIGSLARSYGSVLERLRQHQQYVGNLRGRLVHELRTPIMVVRSSLENLAAEGGSTGAAGAESVAGDDVAGAENGTGSGGQDAAAGVALAPGAADPGVGGDARRAAWLARARDGTQRLERIVASMGEAASLESMLADSELETVDLVALVRACIDGYRDVFAPQRFELDSTVDSAPCPVVPEAIAQALDKLVSNAVDFARAGTTIVLSVRVRERVGLSLYTIAVRNQGPPLPAAMRESLFDSMVSLREHRAGAGTHLGLGLYLVRLVSEFHGGEAFAHDVADGVEAGFTLSARSATA